jgi:hypothetical protein
MSDLPESVLSTVREWNPFHLASEAGCPSPDSADSAGAQFLSSVRDSTIESLDYLFDGDSTDLSEAMQYNGADHDVADSAVPVYTHDLWATFVDLGAYGEDVSDYEPDGSDIEKIAQLALYVIAERLIHAVTEAIETDLSDAVDIGIGRASERGTAEGTNAAAWWMQDVEQRGTDDDYRRILDALDDVGAIDLPNPDLSGQHADGTTIAHLLADADLVGIDVGSDIAQQLADAYEETFTSAVDVEVARICRYHLSD